MIQKLLINIAISLFFIASTHYVSAQGVVAYKMKTVVIDPGHGVDPGAIYGSIKEKNITLAVAKRLGKKISDAYPEIKVIYTRTTDQKVELYKRSQIANDANADLFISIHANSARSSSATGTETFVMGYDKSSQNMAVAMKENQVVTFEKDYKQKYEGFDPNSDESYILFSLMQYSYISQSTLFASYIQKEYSHHTNMVNRGVKQGPLLVLWRATMPSVLTEIGFLSNYSDRKFITSDAGEETIAQSLFNAFKNYKEHVEVGVGVESEQEKIAKLKKDSLDAIAKEKAAEKARLEALKNRVTFKVQLLASRKNYDINYKNFGEFASRIEKVKIGKLYKYFAVGCENYKEALSLQLELKRFKFDDAFIVAYKGGVAVDVSSVIMN